MSWHPLKTLGGGVAAMLIAAAANPVAAADLGGDYGGGYATPYGDSRYADSYGEPERRAPAYRYRPADRDDEDYYDDGGSYEDRAYGDDEADDDGRGPQPRFSDRNGDRCVPHHLVKRRLHAEGWDELQDVELAGNLAILSARRQSGRLFELRVDRCSGEVVDARPYETERYGPRRSRFRS